MASSTHLRELLEREFWSGLTPRNLTVTAPPLPRGCSPLAEGGTEEPAGFWWGWAGVLLAPLSCAVMHVTSGNGAWSPDRESRDEGLGSSG